MAHNAAATKAAAGPAGTAGTGAAGTGAAGTGAAAAGTAAATKGDAARPTPTAAAVSKAVIPAAGLGTRFLPATEATPKEMLPVVDKPAIQYVVEEAAAAGLDDVLLITGRSKRSIEDHFDRAYELEEALAAKDDADRLARVRESSQLATMHYVRQGDPRGLGHAVLCAAQHVGDEPFAVLLGDDLIDQRDPLLTRMIEVRNRYGGSVVALMEVDPEQVSQYGCAAIAPTTEDDVVRVTDLVEKPVPGEAPSRWIVIGRYVCDPAVFGVLRHTPPGRGGEIQLTDALGELARATGPAAGPPGHTSAPGGGPPAAPGSGVHGVLFRGRRYDTGNKLDYLRTLVQFACERPDLADEFVPWLRKYLADLP
jgi:UTP--glucose-1-phosphate uridylyltransferase